MPTFEKSKGLKCQFDTANVINAVKDVMHHHPCLRKAGRRIFYYCQKDHKNQTCIEVCLVDFTNVCSLKTLLELLIISDTSHVSLITPGMSLIHQLRNNAITNHTLITVVLLADYSDPTRYKIWVNDVLLKSKIVGDS